MLKLKEFKFQHFLLTEGQAARDNTIVSRLVVRSILRPCVPFSLALDPCKCRVISRGRNTEWQRRLFLLYGRQRRLWPWQMCRTDADKSWYRGEKCTNVTYRETGRKEARKLYLFGEGTYACVLLHWVRRIFSTSKRNKSKEECVEWQPVFWKCTRQHYMLIVLLVCLKAKSF